jgi:formate hydrogenlyase transcriptional activator
MGRARPGTDPVHETISQQLHMGVSTAIQEQLKFETLLADISAHFINLPADQIDREIEHAQKRICECLGIDHSALWQGSHDAPHTLILTHLFREPKLPPAPDRPDADTYFPWVQDKLVRKEIVSIESTADVPPEAATDKKHWLMYGIKSVLAFPLSIGDKPIFGVLSFEATTKERAWSEPIVHRLQLVAQVFVNALARKRQEQALHDSEERLRLAAASADAGMWMLDTASSRFWTTDKANELFGLGTTEEFDFERFLSLVHQEDRKAVRSTVEKAIQSDEEMTVEYRIIRPDGEMRWISSRGRRRSGESLEPVRLMGVSVDITERKRTDESQRRHSAIVQGSDDAIISMDLKGIIADWNSAAEQIYGYSQEEAVGQKIEFIIPPELRNEEATILTRLGAGESIRHMETVRVRKDGSRVNVSLTVSPIRDSFGRIVGASKIARDISERKRAQENLQKSYAEIRELKEKLQAESDYLQEEVRVIGRYEEIIGHSEALRQVLTKVEQVAFTDSVVLITGESGTGKELVARAIHDRSKRKDRVMVKVDCAALPPTLIESELFGREKGAYTGALTRQIGRVETADGSTLFLDEVGELGVELQAKLLRVVEDGDFERLGSAKTSHVNVRLIAATHRNLAERVKNQTFREDLFYRLNVFPIHVPPLRERLEDIPLLVAAFLREFEKKMGKKTCRVSSRMMDELRRYPWPGNIRELRNIIERAVIVTTGEKLNLQLPRAMNVVSISTLQDAEYQHIVSVLEKTGWRIKGPEGAAAILGMNPSTLYTTMRRLHIPTRHEKGGMQS